MCCVSVIRSEEGDCVCVYVCVCMAVCMCVGVYSNFILCMSISLSSNYLLIGRVLL